jgi:cytochrome P450
MVGYTERMLRGWRSGEIRPLNNDLVRLTLNLIARILFDVDVEQEAQTLSKNLETVLEFYCDPLNSLLIPAWFPTLANVRLRRATKVLNDFIFRLIDKRRKQPGEGHDLLSQLLATQQESRGEITDQMIRDELLTLAFAGHKTTAATLTYSLYLLAGSPEVEARMVDELQKVLGNRPPTSDDLPNLTYTRCVVKEAMRIYPPSWGVGREAIRDVEIGEYHVPRKTQLLAMQWLVHHDPRWYPEPDKFKPERWQGDLEATLPRCAYFPFGDGPRTCIGDSFAMLEIVLVLATIVQRYRMTRVPGATFRLVPSIALWPKPDVQVRVTER